MAELPQTIAEAGTWLRHFLVLGDLLGFQRPKGT